MIRNNSNSYHDYLIQSLKDPEEAAAYLEVALEEDGDPQLLKKAFVNVLEAFGTEHLSSVEFQHYREKLESLFNETNTQAINELVHFLKLFGLQLSVTADGQRDRSIPETAQSSPDFIVPKHHSSP